MFNNTIKYEDKKTSAKILRLQLLNILGDCCARCGKNENLQIDHIKGNGEKDRRERGGPVQMYKYYLSNPEEAKEQLQILCLQDNFAKARENYEQLKINNKPFSTASPQRKYYWRNREQVSEKKRLRRLKQ